MATGLAPRVGHAARPTRIEQHPAGFVLTRADKPFFINGAVALDHLDAFAAAGGNTIRTYGIEHLGFVDEAERRGLTVAMGLPMPAQRLGFDYADAERTAALVASLRDIVRRFRDHPAVLMWIAGNEVTLETGDPVPALRAIEAVARMVKLEDPDHPVATAVADVDGAVIAGVRDHCPAIDLLAINTFGGAAVTAGERLAQAGWTGPFVLGEFGASIRAAADFSPWGAPYEPSSSDKASQYALAYRGGILGNPGRALGGFAFLWGWKQETTHTWHSMFLPDGHRLSPVETMAELWGGTLGGPPAPEIISLAVDTDTTAVLRSQIVTAVLGVDRNADASKSYAWEVREESSDIKTGGDIETIPPVLPDAILSQSANIVRFTVSRPGPYRLFAYVHAEGGGAATANRPFLVIG